MIKRHRTAFAINKILNHPAVFPYVSRPETKKIDLSKFVANKSNYLLMAKGGGVVCQMIAPGVYEGHISFLPEYRGKYAVRVVREAIAYLFENANCRECRSRTPEDNPAARRLTVAAGMKFHHMEPDEWPTRDGMIAMAHYRLPYLDWLEAKHAR